ADALAIDVRPVDARVSNRLVGAVDADAPRASAAADIAADLVLELVEVADAGERLSHVADLVRLHSALAIEQGLAIFGQRVAIGGRQSDAGNDDPLVVGHRTAHAQGIVKQWSWGAG